MWSIGDMIFNWKILFNLKTQAMESDMSGSDSSNFTNGHGFTPNVKKTSAKKVSKIIEEEDPYEKIEVNKDTFKVKGVDNDANIKSSQVVQPINEQSVEKVESNISNKTEQRFTQNTSIEVNKLETQKDNKIENLQMTSRK